MPSAPFFNILDRVDSTNNYAMAMVHAGMANNGMAWFSPNQTAGKGQRGKTWEAEPGRNIALSLVLEPGLLKIVQPFYLSALVALTCREFFNRFAGQGTKIKWPNDIYWNDRKAGGILIENVFHGNVWKYAVIGVGININQTKFSAGLSNPVSLKQITGNEFDITAMAKELYGLMMKGIEEREQNPFDKIIDAYNEQLYALDQKVKLKKGTAVFETRVKGVNKKGQLITSDTTERQFDFGEVEWVGPAVE